MESAKSDDRAHAIVANAESASVENTCATGTPSDRRMSAVRSRLDVTPSCVEPLIERATAGTATTDSNNSESNDVIALASSLRMTPSSDALDTL